MFSKTQHLIDLPDFIANKGSGAVFTRIVERLSSLGWSNNSL